MKASTLVFALTFYCLGATFFEAFVNYRTWHLLGGADFGQYHAALTTLVIRVMLVPIGVTFLSTAALLFSGSSDLPRWMLGVSVGLQVIAIASSIIVQVPLQMQLRALGPSDALLDRLIWTDLVSRKLPLALNGALWIQAMMVRP